MKMKALLFLLVALLAGCASSPWEDTPGDPRRECLKKTTNDRSYDDAIKRVMKLPTVLEWVHSGDSQHRVAFGNKVDATSFVAGKCYWEVSLYDSRTDRLQLWKVFRVAIETVGISMYSDDGELFEVKPEEKP